MFPVVSLEVLLSLGGRGRGVELRACFVLCH